PLEEARPELLFGLFFVPRAGFAGVYEPELSFGLDVIGLDLYGLLKAFFGVLEVVLAFVDGPEIVVVLRYLPVHPDRLFELFFRFPEHVRLVFGGEIPRPPVGAHVGRLLGIHTDGLAYILFRLGVVALYEERYALFKRHFGLVYVLG